MNKASEKCDIRGGDETRFIKKDMLWFPSSQHQILCFWGNLVLPREDREIQHPRLSGEVQLACSHQQWILYGLLHHTLGRCGEHTPL